MKYDKQLIAGKLRRWEKYMENYRLPAWKEIPDVGLHMNQVLPLIRDYLDYMPPELKGEELITAAAVNNYVRKKIMPEPAGRKYYRAHIVYLIIICSLKQSLPIPVIQTIIPYGLGEDDLAELYADYVRQHELGIRYFIKQVRIAAGGILDHAEKAALTTDRTGDLVLTMTVVGGLAVLLAKKLLLLEGKDLTNGGSIEIEERK